PVQTACPNHFYALSQGRDGPRASAYAAAYADPTQYALAKMHLAQAHEFALGERVLVAVIDSGVDLTHPALAGMIAGHVDTIDSDPRPHFHGTGIAGAIAARGKMVGTAPGARILAVRAFGGKNGVVQSTSVSIAQGILWAVQRGARVVNMSFAGPTDRNVA